MYRVQVTIRHFSANNYVNDKDPSAVWNGVSQLPKVFWNKLRKIHLWNMMSTYRWATTSPARSTQPPWLQPSHCLPPLIQVARIVDMTKYCCALTSTGLSLGKLNTLNCQLCSQAVEAAHSWLYGHNCRRGNLEQAHLLCQWWVLVSLLLLLFCCSWSCRYCTKVFGLQS